MTRAVWLLLAVVAVAGQSSIPDIPISNSQSGSSSNTFIQGSGVVNAGPAQNYMDFSFTRTIAFGDQIGFYFFDKTVTVSSVSVSNEYDCGLVASSLKSPLLSISPSREFNMTLPLPYHNISVSPARTPFFGGLGQGRYKLCYCKKPDMSAKNPLGECRPVDYKYSAGVYFFYDAPELKQKRSVNSEKNFNRFLFKIKKLHANGVNQRIVIPDLQQGFQTGFAGTKGCGSTGQFSGSQPSWSNGGASLDETTQKTPLTLVRSTYSFDEVAFQLPPQSSTTSATPEGFYSVCLCDFDNIGTTGSFADCNQASMCETRGCLVPQSAPVEIATVFVHNLGFRAKHEKTVYAMNVADKTVPQTLSFKYSKPANIWASSKSFWFALSSMACGEGTQTAANAYMTLPTAWPGTSPTNVSFATLASSSVLVPYRMCVQQQDNSVLDLDNVVVVVTDVKITFVSGSLSDKISDNNQVGLRPSQTAGITGSQYQKTVNAVAQDHGVWFSENFVDLKLDWTSSIAAYNEIYAVLSSFPCSVSANYSVAAYGSVRSKSHSIAQNLVSASFPLDLGASLWNSTVITPFSTSYSINTSFIAPTPTSQNQNNSLFVDYSLCATCNGCSGYGYELGSQFRVLAALHVYQDVGFEKPYRFNRAQQNIVIASAAVPTSTLPALLFLSTDQLYFADSCCPCFDWATVGFNTNSSAPVYGNQTVYTSKTTGTSASLLNAFQYSFDFAGVPEAKADGRLFKLCVARVNEPVMDFPGCAVSIIKATSSPTLVSSSTSTLDTRAYAASPDGSIQKFVLKSVVTDNVYNSIMWKFKNGPVDAADRLSVSAIGDGANDKTECLANTYSFTTALANGNGQTSVSPATSSAISGMLPGQYALCYCNVKVTGANIASCRTARDFGQFVGYVYFDGSYQGTDYVRSWAVAYNTEQNIKLKMTSGSQNDRLMIIPSTGTCGTDYGQDTALSGLPMNNPAVTQSPTLTKAPVVPTKGPTKAPITSAPSAKPTALPTKAPSKSPTISPTAPTAAPITKTPTVAGRRRLLQKAPTHAPITRSPTRAPITSSPSTTAPSKAPITVAPTAAPVTSAPTKFPTLNPLAGLNKGATAYTKSPTVAGSTLPYVEMSLATARKFLVVGQFKLCYCWHNRYSSVGATSLSSSVTTSYIYPTAAPITSAPTIPTAAPITSAPTVAGRRRLLANSNTFTQFNYANTTGTSCLMDVSNYQHRWGTEVGMLIVHDVYMVSGTSSSNQPTTTHRMAVRAVGNQIVSFYHQQSYAFYVNGVTGWFQKVGVTCSNCGISGTSSGCVNSFGLNGQSLFSGTFDFSNGFARDCNSGNRRKNDYATIEESFFYRLCQQQGGTLFDFSNVMVTVTDIKILDGYQNPLRANAGTVPVKFNEACGFLWNERDWRKPTLFRFVANDKVCSFGTSSLSATSVDYTYESATTSKFVEYFMYEGSLIKYFLDDNDYSSVVTFGGVPRFRVPYRMCMYIQSSTGFSTTGTTLDWVDFPDVTLSIVSARVKISTKQNEYATTTQSNCPLGFLGCKCFADNTCSTTHMYRDLDNPLVGLAATCIISLNLCVAPVRSLSGTRETYTSSSASAPVNVTCTSLNPCRNPGPYPNVVASLYWTFAANDLNANDKIRFVKGSETCACQILNNCQSASELVTNLQTASTIIVDTRQLSANEYHRLCVYTAYSTLDYFSTGFTKDLSTTVAPSTHTLKPTTWYNKGLTTTFSPTLVNPEFFSNQRYPLPQFDNLTPSKFNMLHIVQTSNNNPPLYAQWTNFTIAKIMAQDTLRVYRMVESRATTTLAHPTDTICTPSWSRTQTLEQNDMVMELRVNKDQTDTTTTSGAVATVQFPPLAKGYYTVCFCRKTPSGRCQMTSAGMIYSSAAKHVSVTGLGTINKSFRVTPLLDYEITPELFNVTRSQFITPEHFCLSNATAGCSSCRFQGGTQQTNIGVAEFSFALTSGSFPLVITNKVEHATGTTDKVYSLCFQDPMLMQFRTQSLNSTHLVSTRSDINNTWFHDTWNFAQIGTVYFSDLTFQWEQSGGFTAARTSYSVAVGTNTMARLQYTGSSEVIQVSDFYWFVAANYPCDSQYVTGASTAQQTVPAKGANTYLSFSGVTAGVFYRLCLRPSTDTSIYRDFGVGFGVWVTDIRPSATTFHFFESFHLSLVSSLSLTTGDEFFLLHVAKSLCSEYSTLTAGWVSPNMGVYNHSLYHNMGKMPQVTLAGVYPNIPLGFAGYRLCVKRTQNDETTYIDYAGVLFNPEGSNHVVQNVVAKVANVKIRILSGLSRDFSSTGGSDTVFASFTVQPGDVVWFRRSDVSCAKDVWNSASSALQADLPGGAKLSSSRVTVAATHYDQMYGQYMQFDFDFGYTDVSSLPFRMCVERLSWVNDDTNAAYLYAPTIVQEYPNVFVTVSGSALSTTTSPTSFQQIKVKPTTAPGTTVSTTSQVVTVYTSTTANQFTWSFTGRVDPANDKLAIVAALPNSPINCNGNSEFADPLFLLAASNHTAVVSGPSTTTPMFGAVASGKYFICYCQAATSITGDCSNELGWRQTVGFLYSFAVTPTDLSVSKLDSGSTALTVWFNQAVENTMRFTIIGNSGTCGTSALLTQPTVPPITVTQPTAEIETTGSTVATGLTFNSLYKDSTVGVYQLCFCPQTCSHLVSNFGGKVSDLIIHDILIDGKQTAVSLRKTTNSVINMTMNQSLFRAGADQLWFARNDCGMGNHTPTQNLTATAMMPVSGNTFTLNYSLAVPSMDVHKLCVRNASSGKVYSFSSLGFIATDINLTVTSPVISSSTSIGISYSTGLQVLSTNPGARVLFFRSITQTCNGACDTISQTCTVAADQHTTSSQQVTTSFHTTNQNLLFDLSRLTTLNAYRLCVLVDRTANNPKTFIDFNDIRIYPVPSDTEFFVRNGAALHQDNYNIFLATPQSNAGVPRITDSLYFRRFDLPCMNTAPTVADVNTSSAFTFRGNTFIAAQVNFGAVNMTQMVFRLCVVTSTGVMLDYNSKKLYLTTVVVSTKVCRPSGTACRVSLRVTNPEGLFSATAQQGPNAINLWFQRETAAVRACTSTVPVGSTPDSSRFASYGQLTDTGTIDFDFSQVTSSLTTPLKLCVFNPVTQVTADFPTISLFALDIRLAPASTTNIAPATMYVTRSQTAVRILAAAASLPIGSRTWFQLNSTSCVLPTAANANQTAVTTTASSLELGVDLMYDFSAVTLNFQEQKTFRLCFSVNGAVIDANTVAVIVLEYSVSPAYVGSTTRERILVDPSKNVDLSYYAFCKIDTPCPTLANLKDVSTVNCSSRGISLLPSASSELDFSNVVSEGKLLKLCGVRLEATSPYDVRDLQPKGVFQGSLAINLKVAHATSTSTTIVTTWSALLGNATTGDKIWFQARDVLCSTTSQAVTTSATGTADVKASPFSSVFDFSKITDSPFLKMCASIGGSIKDFTETTISLVTASLGATSVKVAAGQNFTITYSSSPALGSVVRAFFSSDATCAATAAPVSTPSVASTSGAVHSMDFSAVTASAAPYFLCLAGTTTLAVDFAMLYVTDVAYLGHFVSGVQSLNLAGTVSLVSGDSVWFSSTGCSATTGKSSSVNFTGTNAYTFDFTGTTASLTTEYSMCVQRSPTMTYRYSSSSVLVFPSLSLGKVLVGSRTLDLSTLSSFLGSSMVAFVADSAACSTGTYVASNVTVYNFTAAATYRLCVKQTTYVTYVRSVSVVVQDCSQICPASRAVGGACDTSTGKCTQCTAHFTGDQCQTCAAGYSGVGCETCNTAANYNCASGASVSGFCALTDTCTVCGCNGHFDPAATSRCPMNVCVCAAGYAGADCGSCSVGFYKTVTNGTTAFTCNSCADKCYKHASSCTADVCQCSDNYDSVSSCRYCKVGFVQNTTTGVCVQTSSPTRVPSRSPTRAPTRAPTVAPTVNPCAGSVNSVSFGLNCTDWASQNFCADGSQWKSFMDQNCKKTCCDIKAAAAPAARPSSPAYCIVAADAAQYASNCSGWQAAGYCTDSTYQSFMTANCATSCAAKNNPLYGGSSTSNPQEGSSCTQWATAGYCGDEEAYGAFTQANCPKSCCNAIVASFVDSHVDCPRWAVSGFCTDARYEPYMLKTCGPSCRRNALTQNQILTVCKIDLHPDCKVWKPQNFCEDPRYKPWMDSNCAGTCGSTDKPAVDNAVCSGCSTPGFTTSADLVTSCATSCCANL